MEKVNGLGVFAFRGTADKINVLAALILAAMILLGIFSVRNDSATMDELAHIPAGFGYVSQLDYRLNPEHPPLIKAVSALSARIFVNPYFPTDTKAWRDDVNGQWEQGAKFLYESGNDAEKIIFWSRLPLIIFAAVFGWIFFVWAKNRFGGGTALLALVFFAFSPTVLAHSRYVTTDLGAAFGFFLGIAAFLRFLEFPSRRNVMLAGLAFGFAQLLKFSSLLLIPVYGAMLFFWIVSRGDLPLREAARLARRLVLKTFAAGLTGLALVWAVYAPFVYNYPAERQYRDSEFILNSYKVRPVANLDLWLAKNSFTRPLAEYLLGVLMVSQRASAGNTGVFLGEVSATGSKGYFPLLYLVKEPLPFHILSVIAVVFAFRGVRGTLRPGRGKTALNYLRELPRYRFVEFSFLFFAAFYWTTSVVSPLNIGVRHILPVLPFVYILVAKQITEWLRWHKSVSPQNWFGWLQNVYQLYIASLPKYLFAGVMVLWLVAETLVVFPHFLSYYNFLSGGAKNGYKIAVDSNYDWGQDLKRLKDFVEENGIEKISFDYFGGGSPRYYLGNRFEPWRSARGQARGWFAVSVSFREGAFGAPVKGFVKKPEDSYEWLKPYREIARIGYSIAVYKLPDN